MKKRGGGPPAKGERPKPEGAFHNAPFREALKELAKPKAPAPRTKPPPPRPAPPRRAEPDDAELFLQAMDGVAPIPDRGRPPEIPNVPVPARINEDAEALAQLAELVSGQGAFDIADTDEFIEGVAPEVDRRILLALRGGQYAVQGHLDLHGMTKVEARDAVERFLHDARLAGKRCVLLVHGRGLNSKDHIPVLKEQLQVWLNRGRIGKGVLAFATARPHDGGAGALYVLLRR